MEPFAGDFAFVLNHQGELVYMHEGLMAYYNRDNCAGIGYPPGRLEQDDIVVYLHKSLDSATRPHVEELVAAMGACVPREAEGTVISVCTRNSKKGQPLIKWVHPGAELLLDTVYRGHEIVITHRDGKLEFTVGGSRLSAEIGDWDEFLFVVGEGGLKYFSDANPASRQVPFGEVLRGEPYQGYSLLALPFPGGVPLDYLLSPRFIQACSLDSPVSQTFLWQGESVHVEKTHWRRNGEPLLLCRVFTGATAGALAEQSRDILECLERRRRENTIYEQLFTSARILGGGGQIQGVRHLLGKVAATDARVLLTGESGTGKTFLANEIHKVSKRREGPFIHVNCASIPYSLIESELFGYAEGAFTGAKRGGKKGFFELAQRGTIFLDEIGELPLELQGRLLEVMQHKTFYRVGGSEKVHVDVRIIAATNQNLRQLVEEKKMREDLYYRINVFCIELPPLRERRDDIVVIAQNLLPRICERSGLEPLQWSNGALDKLRRYDWPGNIRELENVIEKATILCEGKVLLPEDIVIQPIGAPQRGKTLRAGLESYEKSLIEDALRQVNGSRSEAARLLGIGRTTLFEKMGRYHIH